MKRISGSIDMSVSDTYLLASKARSKLQYEASRNDHDLRILVSHANMLDNIMDSLAQRRRKQQADAILINESQVQSNKPVTFELSKPDRQSQESHYEVYEEEEEYSDEYEDEYEDSYFDEEEDDDDEDDDDLDYDLFEDCQLVSNRAYQTNKVQYRSLPTVDELPLDEIPDDTEDLQSNIPQTPLISSHPTSVAIIKVSDQEAADEQTLSSSPISEVPSLCYSESDSEKEDDEDEEDQVSSLRSEQVEQNESQIPIKPVVQPTFKRLLLPSPEQLDMMIR